MDSPDDSLSEERELFGSSERACKTCGKPFVVQSSSLRRYCSAKCKPLQVSTKVKGVCLQCKRPFVGKRKQTTCSQICRDRLRKQQGSRWYTPVTLRDITCQECKKTFKGNKSQRYCSPECRAKGYKVTKTSKKRRK